MLGSLHDAVAKPAPGGSRYPGFDGLRAIAAASVVAFHCGFATNYVGYGVGGRYVSALNLGVTIFFVISGFLLYRPFVAARLLGHPEPALRDYLVRRVARIVPAYWLAFVALTALGFTGRVSLSTAPMYLLFLQIYFPQYALGGLPVAWSLCTEMSFYLFLPVYAWVLSRLGGRGAGRILKSEAGGIGALVAISIVFRVWVYQSGKPGSWLFWLPANLDLFACGMGLAVVAVWMERKGLELATRTARLVALISWGVALTAFWALGNLGGLPHTIFPVQLSLIQVLYEHLGSAVVASALVVPAVIAPWSGGIVRRLLACPPARFIGVVSFGIYLWHQAIIRWVTEALGAHFTASVTLKWSHVNPPFWVFFLIVLCLAATVAAVSYVLVEVPVLRRAHRRRNR